MKITILVFLFIVGLTFFLTLELHGVEVTNVHVFRKSVGNLILWINTVWCASVVTELFRTVGKILKSTKEKDKTKYVQKYRTVLKHNGTEVFVREFYLRIFRVHAYPPIHFYPSGAQIT